MTTVLVFQGEYDLSLRKRIRSDLDAVRSQECAVLDLREVSYCEASCLAEFVLLARDREEIGVARLLVVPSPAIRRLLEITRLDGLFTVVENLADALGDDSGAVVIPGARGYESLLFGNPSPRKSSISYGII